MKTRALRIISMLVVISLCVAMSSSVFAATPEDNVSPQASYYISSVYASISGGNGAVTVYFDICGTGKMDSVGATAILIKNSSGTIVKTYIPSSSNGMMGYDKTFHSGTVTYSDATAGSSYYAVVYFKAAKGSGYDTSYYTTDLARA